MENLVATNLAEFISLAQKLLGSAAPDFRLPGGNGQTFYRGHGDASWKVEPSLYRSGLAKSEQLLVSDALRLAPGEFTGLSHLQSLAKMQHLGLPTRLIDITTNPLAALYFACKLENVDGEVIVFSGMPTFGENHQPTPTVMEFIFGLGSGWYNLNAQKFSECVSDNYRYYLNEPLDGDTLRRRILNDLQQPYATVTIPNSENRLTRQSGAFLISGMSLSEQKVSNNPGTLGKVYWNFEPCDVDRAITANNDLRETPRFPRIRIPNYAKPKIMAELDRIDVNEMRLFPEPEHTMRYIYENYRTGRWTLFGEAVSKTN